jgi:ParB-like chromosome segregation protein Spo0J
MTQQNLSIRYLPIAALQLNPRNARLHTEKQVRQLANSISSFGFNVPVLVDSQLQVVAGHGRVLACQKLGIPEVPTICLEHLSEHQRRAFALAGERFSI